MNKIMHLIKERLKSHVERNVRNLPKSKNTIIFDCAIGWFMGGFSIGVSVEVAIHSQDAITVLVGIPAVMMWVIGFFAYGVVIIKSYLEEMQKANWG